MTTEQLFESAGESSFPRFNAFENAATIKISDFPIITPESRNTTGALGVALYDSTQNQPFSITDDQGRVIATAPDSSDDYDITDSGNVMSSASSCSSCGCREYTARGFNRNAFARSQYSSSYSSYSDCDDGSCSDDEDDYYPEDDGGCGPGPGGGLLRGLLSRFGRGGLFGLFRGGGCGGGFGRFFRR